MTTSKKIASAIFLLLIGVLAGRGAMVLVDGTYVTTPKHGPGPVVWTGAPAYCMGAFYLLLAVSLGAAYSLELGAPRRPAVVTALIAALAAVGVAAYGWVIR